MREDVGSDCLVLELDLDLTQTRAISLWVVQLHPHPAETMMLPKLHKSGKDFKHEMSP